MLATMVSNLTKLLLVLLLGLRLVSASPIRGDATVEARQNICSKGQSFGCLPRPGGGGGGSTSWNSFDLAIPAVGDPLVHNAHAPGGQVRAENWNRADGTVFLAIRLGEDYEPQLPNERVVVQAWIGNDRITLTNDRFHYFYDVALATIPAKLVTKARKKKGPVIITIKWNEE